MKRIMLVASMMIVMLMFSMVGCHAVPRTPMFHGIKYEMHEEITVKQEFNAEKHTLPTATASIGFSQHW